MHRVDYTVYQAFPQLISLIKNAAPDNLGIPTS